MLSDYLSYDPETGHLTWVGRPANCVKVGTRAGAVTSDGYLGVCV